MNRSDSKFNIICLSNQLWDYPLWTNKKHVMTRLAAQGHNVLFVDPPINTGRLFFRHLQEGRWPLKRLLTWQRNEDNIRVFSPLFFAPFKNFITKIHLKRLNNIIKKFFDPTRKTILWIYHVEIEELALYLDNLKYDGLVYDCVDNYAAFPKYNTPEKKEKLIKQEEYLVKRADIVFATAPGLVDRLKRLNEHTFYTPNVGDYERFIKTKNFKDALPADLGSIPRPRIGFTGAVDEYKFDSKLVRKLCEDFPSYSFIIIGPLALKDKEASLKEIGLDGLDNVYYLGTKKFEDMPKYYAGFDAAIIPYQLNDYTVGGCFPVKFHETLAAGVPVIVTDMPAYKPFADVCYISKSYNEFSQNVRRALEEDNEKLADARRKVAKENNWEGKVAKMLSLIKSEVLTK